jgi:hypothetical protein
VVEASFRPATAKVALVQWAGEASWPLPLAPIDYRVRYSATVGLEHPNSELITNSPPTGSENKT